MKPSIEYTIQLIRTKIKNTEAILHSAEELQQEFNIDIDTYRQLKETSQTRLNLLTNLLKEITKDE